MILPHTPGTMQLTPSNKPCGIVHVEAGNNVYLPLERAEVHADIVDGAYCQTRAIHWTLITVLSFRSGDNHSAVLAVLAFDAVTGEICFPCALSRRRVWL